jgi:hypothetical protein
MPEKVQDIIDRLLDLIDRLGSPFRPEPTPAPVPVGQPSRQPTRDRRRR